MRRFLSVLAAIILLPIILALFVGLYFAMPAELIASGYHIHQASEKVTGQVISADSESHKSNSRSNIVYTYNVNGVIYEGDRVRAGLFSDGSYESGSGDLASSLTKDDQIQVHYDPSNPTFSLLAYGYPKWSIGFSLVVWGITLSNRYSIHKSKALLGYGISSAMTITGSLVIFFLSPTIHPNQLPLLTLVFISVCIIAILYRILRLKQTPIKMENKSQ